MEYRRAVKKRILLSLTVVGAVLSASSLSLGGLSIFFETAFYGFEFLWWILLSGFFLLGALAALQFSFSEKKPSFPPPPNFPEFEKFMKECKLSFRGHLKLSILFWILAYRKEKAKSFEDAKREVFLEVKKEIPHVRWMDSILSEVQEELSKVKQ